MKWVPFAFVMGMLFAPSCAPKCPDCPACPDTAARVAPCPAADAGAPEVDAGAAAPTCEGVCVHLADLGCSAAKPTPEGHTCAEVCNNVQSSGIVSWDLACRAKAKTCTALDACK